MHDVRTLLTYCVGQELREASVMRKRMPQSDSAAYDALDRIRAPGEVCFPRGSPRKVCRAPRDDGDLIARRR